MDPVLGYDDEELVAVAVDDRNWRGIGISLLVIAAIFSLIGLAIFLMTPNATDDDGSIYQVDLVDILGSAFKPRLWNGTWISGNEFVFEEASGNVAIYDCETNGTSRTLVRASTLREHKVDKWTLSADRKFVLFSYEAKKILNYSKVKKFKIFTVDTEVVMLLEDIARSGLEAIPDPMFFQYASWTPRDSALIFVLNNDIYYISSVASSKPIRITSNGVPGLIFNGIGDWLYREKVATKFLWPSPDGRKLAFASFDDSPVRGYPIRLYSHSNAHSLTPEIFEQRYPKAGQVNPKVTLFVADLTEGEIKGQVLSLPSSLAEREVYLANVHWAENDALSVLWVHRSQNSSTLGRCAQGGGRWTCTDRGLPLKSNIPSVADLASAFLHKVTADGTLILRFPRPDSVTGTFYNVAIVGPEDTTLKYVTHGSYDVHKIVTFDANAGELYFQAAVAEAPWRRHIYRTTFPSTSKSAECLTCALDTACGHFEAHFSPNNEFYVLECLGPLVPYSLLKSTRNDTAIPAEGHLLDNNTELRAALKPKKVPKKEIISVPIDNSIRKVNVMVYTPPKPNDEEEEETPPHPVVFESPYQERQSLSAVFGLDIGDYMASKMGFTYVRIDRDEKSLRALRDESGIGRSTNSRQKQFYDEQLQVMLATVKKLYHVDPLKVATWGKGSAAFNALTTLALDKDHILKCALAVAPITSWRYMDTITAEHFYGQPLSQENYAIYESSGLIASKLPQLSTRRFLVLHGTADETVHIQNTMLLTKALIEQSRLKNQLDIDYSSQLYPDEDHDFEGSQAHLYKTMSNYLSVCFELHKLTPAPAG